MKIKKYSHQKNDQLARKLLSYAGMSGAFLAASAPTDAQVIYTDVNPDILVQGSTQIIDMDNDAAGDYSLQQFGMLGSNIGAKLSAPSGFNSNLFMGTIGSLGYYYPSHLMAGAVISAGGNFLEIYNAPGYEASLVFAYPAGNYYGNWSNKEGYVGVQFYANGNTYFGWIELAVDSLGQSITLKSYAYESTPNMQIIAGDTGVVGINEQAAVANFEIGKITPNPSSNGMIKIYVEAKESHELRFEIMNGMGAVIASEDRKIKSGRSMLHFDFSSLSSGSYFVKISDGNQSTFRKLIITE